MDATRFDTLTRTMAAPTRRAALRGLAGVLLGALAAASPVARRTTTVLACDPDGTDCSNNVSCCSGFCDTAPPVGDGTFGKCEKCEGSIPKERLRAIAYARLCVKCQTAEEQG